MVSNVFAINHLAMQWSVNSGAKEFGVAISTLKRRLVEAGHEVGRGGRWTTLQLHDALRGVGDMEAARYREVSARAELLEIDVRRSNRELVTQDEARAIIAGVLQPIRQWLLALPATAGPRVNPVDPKFGMDALQTIVDAAWAKFREERITEASDTAAKANPTKKRIRGRGGKAGVE